jgi:DNA modification methylase
MLLLGNCLEKLKELKDNSVEAVITDPPYGLNFMGKEWDRLGDTSANYTNLDKPHSSQEKFPMKKSRGRPISETDGLSQQKWHYEWAKEVYRVLKSGGHLLSFGGSRTYHRMACAIEDAGFEIRDQIMWVYGSGFPKSLNIGKKMDGTTGKQAHGFNTAGGKENFDKQDKSFRSDYGYVYEPKTELGKTWEGYGTALKPAHEPIVLARKPLSEKTVAENCLKWGVGGLNIDGCRVGSDTIPAEHQGRFPANFIHDGSQEVLDLFPNSKSTKSGYNWDESNNDNPTHITKNIKSGVHFGDNGSAARFFYCAKASKRERDMGCEGLEEKSIDIQQPHNSKNLEERYAMKSRNNHPTVKPLALMKYLVKLVSREGQTVLDPFMGSGTTGIACKELNREFIGIEMSEEYLEIAKRRINA